MHDGFRCCIPQGSVPITCMSVVCIFVWLLSHADYVNVTSLVQQRKEVGRRAAKTKRDERWEMHLKVGSEAVQAEANCTAVRRSTVAAGKWTAVQQYQQATAQQYTSTSHIARYLSQQFSSTTLRDSAIAPAGHTPQQYSSALVPAVSRTSTVSSGLQWIPYMVLSAMGGTLVALRQHIATVQPYTSTSRQLHSSTSAQQAIVHQQ